MSAGALLRRGDTPRGLWPSDTMSAGLSMTAIEGTCPSPSACLQAGVLASQPMDERATPPSHTSGKRAVNCQSGPVRGEAVRRIGVWNTAFLGDAVLTLPLLQTLHRRFPDAEIHFWVRKGVGALFTAVPCLAAVHEFDKRGTQGGGGAVFGLGRALARQGFDIWVNAHTSLRSGLVARATGAPVRIGYDRPWYNRLLHTHVVDRRFDELDEIERLLQLVGPLAIEDRETWPELVLPADARERAEAYWQRYVRGPVLGMHPGSVWATKRWTAAHFAEVARRAAAEGAQVMLFAGPGEETVARSVVAMAGLEGSPALLDMAGALSLVDLAAWLGRLDCYLSNDSGPMHIAWAQRTPVTAVFGPTVRRLGFYPRGEGTTVFEVDLDCRPCGLHGPQQCPLGHHRCMTDVTPDMVWPDIRRKLFGQS